MLSYEAHYSGVAILAPRPSHERGSRVSEPHFGGAFLRKNIESCVPIWQPRRTTIVHCSRHLYTISRLHTLYLKGMISLAINAQDETAEGDEDITISTRDCSKCVRDRFHFHNYSFI